MSIDNVKYCYSFKDRFLGLMFKHEISNLCFPKCKSIHTFFMFENIDVIFTDKNKKVIKIYKNVKPNRIIIDKNAYYVYELKKDTYKIKLGDIIS